MIGNSGNFKRHANANASALAYLAYLAALAALAATCEACR